MSSREDDSASTSGSVGPAGQPAVHPASQHAPVYPASPAAPVHPAARPAPVAAALRLLLPLAAMLALVALTLALLAGALRWASGSEGGTRWVLSLVPGLEVQGLQGALADDTLRAERVRMRWNRDRAGLEIEGLVLDGLRWSFLPQPGVWLGLDVQRAEALRVRIESGPPGPRPIAPPPDLVAPAVARVAEARVAELLIDAQAPLTDLSVRGALFDGRPGQRHSVAEARARGHGLAFEARASIGNLGPHVIEGQATVTPTRHAGAAPPWVALLSATGPLATLDVSATLRGVPRDGGTPPQLDLRSRLRPLEAWPLAALEARTEALDLSELWPDAPETALSGRIDARAPGRDQPVAASVKLSNGRPGRWNERRLPLAALEMELAGRLDRRDRIDAPRIVLQLADARGAAGRVEGDARWVGHALTVDARLAGVTPQRLDGRAAAMTLSGPVKARLDGLPAPDASAPPSAAAAPPARPGAARPAAKPAPPPPWQLSLEAELDGRLEGAPTAVQVAATLQARDGRLEVPRLRASAGPARADLQATLERESGSAAGRAGGSAAGRESGSAAGRAWQLQSAGTLTDFDPLPWWPGTAGGAWRQGPHRLNAGWQLDLRLPPTGTRLAPLAWLQSLAGNGRLRLHESLLAGVPLGADVALGYGTGGQGTVKATFELGGNRVVVDGSGQPAGAGDSDRWRVDVQAPMLATLAPLARLHPGLAEWVPRQGSVKATLAADGRWPRLATQGSAQVEQLRAGTLGLASGELRWSLRLDERDTQAPLTLSADLTGMQLGGQRADQLRAEMRGTLAEHRIELDGTLPVAPPAAVSRLLGLAPHQGTRAQLRADGRWQNRPGDGGRWAARVERLAIGAWDGRAPGGGAPALAANATWFDARELRADLAFDRQGTLTTLSAEPGRVRLADGIVLRWDAVQADLTRTRPDFELRADIEPFALAPLLARAQPGMGWKGDLTLAARVAVKAAERFEADLVFERRGGDLHLDGSDGLQLFGLTDVRLALTARDGVWDFAPQFNGRSLGEIRGSLRARTTPAARWPDADAPIEGQVQARVADIGIWSAWVPAGWRLAGELRTTASVGGRLGAPTYTGELTGSGLAVRNLLQGVNLSEGRLRVRLSGDTASIEQASARGGDGRIEVTGGALFGSSPSARLQLTAERFRVIGRVDRQLSASGRAELTLADAASRLDGAFRIDEGLFDFSRADAPSLDDDVTIRDREREDDDTAADGAASQRTRRSFGLGVEIDLGEQLRVRGRGLDSGLGGRLRITNPGGRLAVNGTINARNGTYAAYAQKLDIERGIIAFEGPMENPRLDVLAVRPNVDQRVGVLITGTAQAPRVRLWSDPDLPEPDKLSWLMLGRASDGLGRNDTALLQRAAVALLAGEGQAPTDALMRNLGIDELSVGQRDGEVRETVITLGKQLSRRWYVGYERGVNATTGTWQLIYRAAQRFTVRAQSGLENSLDVIWTWRLQEPPPPAPGASEGGVRKSVPTLPR
jgi:translocation and assembly module TamB